MPTRLPKIDSLVRNICINGHTIHKIKQDAMEVNAALAFCEIAFSLPPAWFSDAEKRMIAYVVDSLWGDPRLFILQLSSNNLSFYNLMRERPNAPEMPDLAELVEEVYKEHERLLGSAS